MAYSVDQIKNVFKGVPPEKWRAAVQSILVDAYAESERLRALLDNTRGTLEKVAKGAFALAKEVRELRVAVNGSSQEAVADPAPVAADRPLTPEEIAAKVAAAEAGGPEAMAAAIAEAQKAMAPPPAPPRPAGAPKAGPTRTAPPGAGAGNGGPKRQAGPFDGKTRLGPDGTPLTPEEEMIERQMDEGIAAAEAAKRG